MPNLMPSDFVAGSRVLPANRTRAEAPIDPRLTLMGALEASLDVSRNSLLALDLAGIEQETAAQIGLIHELNELRRRKAIAPACARESGEDAKTGKSPGSLALEKRLSESRNRILEAVRVQAAFLTRARGKLRILANMLAGPTVIYGPWGTRNDGPGTRTF
jgi:hypothetical protein